MYQWLDLYAPYVALAACALAILALAGSAYLWRQLRAVQANYARLTLGTEGSSLESILDAHLENVRAATDKASQAWETAMRVERGSRCNVQHVAVVRYNPFSHTGGDQSFVLAMADDNGNGAIINSLHARDGTRIYAKPLVAWDSSYALTDEERDAIAKARS